MLGIQRKGDRPVRATMHYLTWWGQEEDAEPAKIYAYLYKPVIKNGFLDQKTLLCTFK